jgi:hypothetical protein
MHTRLGTPRLALARLSPRTQLIAIASAALLLALLPMALTLLPPSFAQHAPNSRHAALAGTTGTSASATTARTAGTRPGSQSTQGGFGPGITNGKCKILSSSVNTLAFCDSFDTPAGTGNRSGDLDGVLWGVSRATGNDNPGQSNNTWFPTQLNLCGKLVTVQAPQDVRICDGHLVEATNDGGTVTTLAMYPKQPFDIAGRTGTVTFDVSDDSQGSHAAWPEFWYTERPTPAPFTHESSWQSYPRNGFGVRFARVCAPGQGGNCGPNCPGDNSVPVVSVDSAVTVHNYVGNDSFSDGNLQVVGDGCVTEPTQSGQMNHIELRISVSQIDVYGTNASTSPETQHLIHLATIPNVALTLTRGLIWLEDVHYNGDKFNSQGTHTFSWDNVAFDGPVLPRDAAYDALDNTDRNSDGSTNLGWLIPPNSSQSISVPGITPSSISNATGALLTFNFFSEQVPSNFYLSVNGHSHTNPWPYPYQLSYSPMTLAVSLPASIIVPGTNTVTFSTDSSYGMIVFNVDLILVGGQGTG